MILIVVIVVTAVMVEMEAIGVIVVILLIIEIHSGISRIIVNLRGQEISPGTSFMNLRI